MLGTHIVDQPALSIILLHSSTLHFWQRILSGVACGQHRLFHGFQQGTCKNKTGTSRDAAAEGGWKGTCKTPVRSQLAKAARMPASLHSTPFAQSAKRQEYSAAERMPRKQTPKRPRHRHQALLGPCAAAPPNPCNQSWLRSGPARAGLSVLDRPARAKAARPRGAPQPNAPATGHAQARRARSHPGRTRSRPARGRGRIRSLTGQTRVLPVPALPARGAQAALGARLCLCSAGRRVRAARVVQRRMHPRLRAWVRPWLRARRAAWPRPGRPRSRPASRCKSAAAMRLRMHRDQLAWKHHITGPHTIPIPIPPRKITCGCDSLSSTIQQAQGIATRLRQQRRTRCTDGRCKIRSGEGRHPGSEGRAAPAAASTAPAATSALGPPAGAAGSGARANVPASTPRTSSPVSVSCSSSAAASVCSWPCLSDCAPGTPPRQHRAAGQSASETPATQLPSSRTVSDCAQDSHVINP